MRSDRASCFGCVVFCLFALGGCTIARTSVERSVVETHPAELDFLDGVSQQPAVSNDDALHGLILLIDDGTAFAGYEERLAFARARGWIGEKETPPGNESATVGMIAVAVCDMLQIKGGVNLWLFGPTRRYCTRELVFLEFLPTRSENQSLSGSEFVDLLGRVDDARDSAAASL